MSAGKRITEIREKRGMTKTELAKRLDITIQGVSNWESGRYNPRPAMLTKVAEALEVDRAYLSDGKLSGEMSETDGTADDMTVGDVLTEAKVEIASILKMPADAITLNFTVSV